jgi:7-keto-8-aminopelargonate synthetase-like enzyme
MEELLQHVHALAAKVQEAEMLIRRQEEERQHLQQRIEHLEQRLAEQEKRASFGAPVLPLQEEADREALRTKIEGLLREIDLCLKSFGD